MPDSYVGVYVLRSYKPSDDTLYFDGIPESVYFNFDDPRLALILEKDESVVTPKLYLVAIKRDLDRDLVLEQASPISGYIPPDSKLEARVQHVIERAMTDFLNIESRHGYEPKLQRTRLGYRNFHLQFILPELRVGIEVHVKERYDTPDWKVSG
jgi:hypothetical protein